jgi:ABC-type xylose transport system substrate-binding protein
MNTMLEDLVEEERVEIEKILNQEETMCIFKEFSKSKKLKNNNIEYRISEKNYFLFIEALNSRMVSNILNSMVNQGVIESAFDSESNDFVFWIKENDENETPETD